MAFVKIRGNQIQDGQLKDQHIASDAAISESKLNINWVERAKEVLESKKVVDFIQVNNQTVGGVSELNLTATGIIPAGAATTDSNELSAEGIIVSGLKNKVVFRDVVTGDPILSEGLEEVHGHVVLENDEIVIKFVTGDGVSHENGTPFVFPEGTVINLQYAQRFNLQTVNEMFAANEKFVEGTADATAHLNIEQLAKDLYGASFSLDRDGNGNLSRALVDELLVQTRGLVNPNVRANAIIDEVVSARGTFESIGGRFADIENKLGQEAIDRANAVQAVRTDLASVEAGKGASLIGVEDVAGNFTGTTVESVLAELDEKIDNAANGGNTTQTEVDVARESSITGAHASLDARIEAGEARYELVKDEVETARTSSVKFEEDGVTPKAFASVDARLEEIEADAKADKEALATYKTANDTALQTEVDRATQAESDLQDSIDALSESVATDKSAQADKDAAQDTRMDKALNADGTLKAGKQIHDHKKFVYQATGGETSINLPEGSHFQADDTLDIYVNGLLQAKGIHYTEMFDAVDATKGIGIDFAPEVLVAGDIVIMKFVNNNAE